MNNFLIALALSSEFKKVNEKVLLMHDVFVAASRKISSELMIFESGCEDKNREL